MAFGRALTLVSIAGLALSACAGPAATPTPTASPTLAPTASPTATPTVAPTPSPSPSPNACAAENLTLKHAGRLTLSTDIPAFPPWWGGDASKQYPNEPAGGSAWSSADFSAEPYSMEGFEGSTAYAIAQAMGFGPDKVDWIANAVFEQAFAPGPKDFDFHMAQVSIRPERAEAVDFSEPYFDSNQSVLALTKNAITGATSIADLKGYKLGAAANTTSFELINKAIQPTVEPQVFPDNDVALTALKNGQIDGLVVDLSTAFYMRDAELEDFNTPDPEGTIVGQFGPVVQVDQVGAVLEKDSPLTPCVSAAIAKIKADGTLQGLLDKWINTGQEVPFLQ